MSIVWLAPFKGKRVSEVSAGALLYEAPGKVSHDAGGHWVAVRRQRRAEDILTYDCRLGYSYMYYYVLHVWHSWS